jgi:3-deoxy-manno-octulosonate cytidylyltransferase (CMP-KDO synthetase)
MKVVGVIPARFDSTRLPGKPLKDICGKPMLWWTYNQVSKVVSIDELYVATNSNVIYEMCKENKMNVLMTGEHETPTDRVYEVSTLVDGDMFVFVGGDEPLIDSESIDAVIPKTDVPEIYVSNAMTTIKTAPEVIDSTNIKVVVNESSEGLYVSRSPLPYPKGSLDFEYKKFVGISVLSRTALEIYHNTPRSKLENIEECDLIRFITKHIVIHFVDVNCRSVSVDTQKDLDFVRSVMSEKLRHVDM